MKRAVMMIVFAACTSSAALATAQGLTPSATTPMPAVREVPQAVSAAIPPQTARPTTPPAAPIQERPSPAPGPVMFDDLPNVRVEVTITYQVGQGAIVKRSASLLVASGDQGSLRSGNQVPVPSGIVSTTNTVRAEISPGMTPPPVPMTSFNYRSVGLNVDARRVRVAGNKAKMDLSVEFSAIDEKAADGLGRTSSPPSFPTFSQSMALILENGKPLVIAQTTDVVDNVERKQSVEVKATILR